MKSLIIIILSVFSFSVMAKDHMNHKGMDHADHKHEEVKKKQAVGDVKYLTNKTQKNDVHLKVHGMVCAFCAQGVKKKLGGEKSVKSVKVDLDSMSVFVDFKPKMNLVNNQLIKAIEDSGFKVVSVSRKK